MIRAFLAIDLPASLRAVVTRAQEELKKSGADVKWVPPGNVHLTLKFFGNITEERVEALAQAASRVAGEQTPFSLTLTQAGAFPSPKNPRVVWLGVGGNLEAIAEFHRRLEAAFAALGFPPEDRPFAPHLTLGRVRSPAGRLELSRRLATLPPVEAPPFQVSEIVLFRSNLSPQGATYLPLKIIPLGV
uniref:RNA 2',3'-cyclic phosphodiesterase n=1 Tax=Desulfobacca acetoxidans TaxID=60893 RepID=A0A7V4G6P0_9BACT